MARIDDAITAAEGQVTEAKNLPETTDEEKATKATKVAAAEARIGILRDQKQAIEDDINDAVRGRIPDPKEAQKKAVAAALGIPVEQVTDEKIREVKEAWEGTQSAVQRAENEKSTLEERIRTLESESSGSKKQAQSARKLLRDQMIENAVRGQLLTMGVINETEETKSGDKPVSYLDRAVRDALSTGIATVEIEIKDDNTLDVKNGGVQKAKEAAEKVKEDVPAFFGDPAPQRNTVNPPNPPRRNRDQRKNKEGGYRPNHSLPPGAQKAS